MDANTMTNGPVPGPTYVPYFYESGLHRLYLQSPSRGPKNQQSVPHGVYDFSSDPHPWAAFPGPQTVEQVISKGYFSVPDGDPEEAIITDKQHTSWLGLDDIVGQIRHRQQLYEQNVNELDQGVCEAHNAMFRQEGDQGAPADSRQQYAADKRIQDLYEQRRMERVGLWKDISLLRQNLPESAQQYLSAYRKAAILNDPGDEQ